MIKCVLWSKINDVLASIQYDKSKVTLKYNM